MADSQISALVAQTQTPAMLYVLGLASVALFGAAFWAYSAYLNNSEHSMRDAAMGLGAAGAASLGALIWQGIAFGRKRAIAQAEIFQRDPALGAQLFKNQREQMRDSAEVGAASAIGQGIAAGFGGRR